MSRQARHGDTSYPVIGETDATSGELVSAIRRSFPMVPDPEILDAVHQLRDLNDLYGALLSEDPADG